MTSPGQNRQQDTRASACDTRRATEDRRRDTKCHRWPDRDVAVRSPGWIVVTTIMAAAVMISRESAVEACGNLPGPGILARSVWPGGADQHPPINARFVVSYQLRATFPGDEVPPLGPDVALLDGDGTPVAASIEVVGSQVVLQPSTALLPNHPYQIADRRTVPCDHNQNGCALTNEPRVFASFTTGATADTTPPIFAGVTSIAADQRETCDNTACCGPFDNVPVGLSWRAGSDDLAGDQLRYNVYFRPAREPATVSLIAGLIEGAELRGFQTCSGTPIGYIPQRVETAPGTYTVRAVDWAGNEESSSAGQVLGDVCSSAAGQVVGEAGSRKAAGCAVSGAPGADGSASWWAVALGAFAALALRPSRAPARRRP
jgi:hypothetical protein